MIAGSLVAQESFELTPAGFINSAAPSDAYLVIEAPGKSQEDIYKAALAYLHGTFVNPDEALSTMEGEMITVNGYAENSIARNSMHVFDMNYSYSIRFKDGKMRIDAPSFRLTTYTNKPQELHLVWTGLSLGGDDLGIYGKKDRLKSERAKEDLEAFFNTQVELLSSAVKEDQDNW